VTNTQIISTAQTVLGHITVEVKNGGKFKKSGTGTLHIENLIAGSYKIFDGFSAGDVTLGAGVKEALSEWWGAKGDGINNDAAAINSALASFSDGGILSLMSDSDYLISNTLLVPYNVGIVGGSNTRILAASGHSFINNYMIFCNNENGSSQDFAFPNIASSDIQNLTLYNPNAPYTVKGIRCADSRRFTNIIGRQLDNTITVSNDYLDNFEIKRMHCAAGIASGLGYQIVIGQLGDGLGIDNVIIDGDSKGLSITGCYSGSIKNIIGGTEHTITKSGGLTLSNWHCESFVIKIIETDVVFENSLIYHNGTDIPIQFSDASSDGKHVVELKNIMFAVWLSTTVTQDYDIKTHGNFNIILNNVFKKVIETGVIETSEISGIRIKNAAGSDFTEFNDYSYSLSKDSEIGYGELLYYNFVTRIGTGALNMNALQSTSKVTWQKATDTYYYRTQLLFDEGRKIGVTSDEKNIAVTNGSDGVLIPVSYSSYPRNAILRIYRGTVTSSYDEYVDIPVVISRLLYDDGDTINGFVWGSRGAAAADTVAYFVLHANQSDIVVRGASVPANGTWVQGDLFYDETPSAGGKIGEVCTTGGTPGTWKAFGAIDA
jgi:hypothetical protein